MWKLSLPYLPDLGRTYDVAISYLWPHYFVADKVKAKKKIAWIHTDYSTIDTNTRMDLKMWKNFDHIIAVSEACKTSFIKKYPELSGKVIIMENITSPDLVNTLADHEEAQEMKNDPRTKLLTIARLCHQKGIDNAIKAMKRLRDKGYENVAWYVVGYGGDRGELEKLIRHHGLQDSFYLLGKKTNPYPYLRACDIYVQPSRYEGKAVTVLEAQIMGKPVLITNYATANSQLKHGIDGYITDQGVDGIVQGVEELLSNHTLCNELIKNTKKRSYRNQSEIKTLYQLINQ